MENKLNGEYLESLHIDKLSQNQHSGILALFSIRCFRDFGDFLLIIKTK